MAPVHEPAAAGVAERCPVLGELVGVPKVSGILERIVGHERGEALTP